MKFFTKIMFLFFTTVFVYFPTKSVWANVLQSPITQSTSEISVAEALLHDQNTDSQNIITNSHDRQTVLTSTEATDEEQTYPDLSPQYVPPGYTVTEIGEWETGEDREMTRAIKAVRNVNSVNGSTTTQISGEARYVETISPNPFEVFDPTQPWQLDKAIGQLTESISIRDTSDPESIQWKEIERSYAINNHGNGETDLVSWHERGSRFIDGSQVNYDVIVTHSELFEIAAFEYWRGNPASRIFQPNQYSLSWLEEILDGLTGNANAARTIRSNMSMFPYLYQGEVHTKKSEPMPQNGFEVGVSCCYEDTHKLVLTADLNQHIYYENRYIEQKFENIGGIYRQVSTKDLSRVIESEISLISEIRVRTTDENEQEEYLRYRANLLTHVHEESNVVTHYAYNPYTHSDQAIANEFIYVDRVSNAWFHRISEYHFVDETNQDESLEPGDVVLKSFLVKTRNLDEIPDSHTEITFGYDANGKWDLQSVMINDPDVITGPFGNIERAHVSSAIMEVMFQEMSLRSRLKNTPPISYWAYSGIHLLFSWFYRVDNPFNNIIN